MDGLNKEVIVEDNVVDFVGFDIQADFPPPKKE